MSTTVTYKGSTLTTAENQTKKLKTSGKYMEDDVTLVDVTAAQNPQEKSVAITSAGTEVVTPDVGYDALSKVTITTPSTSCEMDVAYGYSYVDDVGVKFYATPRGYYSTSGWINSGYDSGDTTYWDILSSGTTVTPTESSQTVGGSDVMMRDAITINAIPSNYVGTSVPRRDDNSLSIVHDQIDNEDHVIALSGYYQNNAELLIPPSYVGTGVARCDEDNVLFNGSGLVGVTTGYYPSNTTKQIPSASIYGGYDASVTPSITVNASGEVTATVGDTQTFAFCYGSGWVNTSAETDIRIQGGNTYQLTVGDNLEYGITDGTLPLVGVAKVGYAEI